VVTVAKDPSTTTLVLSESTSPASKEHQEIFHVFVTPSYAGQSVAGATVEVMAGSTLLCTIEPLKATGAGVCSPPGKALSAGHYSVRAIFEGTSSVATSTSAPETWAIS
jgi:hypothetical protein